jgi:hypothetical protein
MLTTLHVNRGTVWAPEQYAERRTQEHCVRRTTIEEEQGPYLTCWGVGRHGRLGVERRVEMLARKTERSMRGTKEMTGENTSIGGEEKGWNTD